MDEVEHASLDVLHDNQESMAPERRSCRKEREWQEVVLAVLTDLEILTRYCRKSG